MKEARAPLKEYAGRELSGAVSLRSAAVVSTADLSPGFLDVMPSSALRRDRFPNPEGYNSAWDMIITTSGEALVPLCAELNSTHCAKVYRYDLGTGGMDLCFNVSDVTLWDPRHIPPSKIHSSMCEMIDGRIVMTTHTTAAAVNHPGWLPEQNFYHLHEGYAGSSVLIYDPATQQVENLGIPVPRDSIYGACYDARHNALYFITWLRGHLYRMDLETRQIRDMGQVTEYGSFRIAPGPDGHLYSSTRSGWLYRINVDSQTVEMLGCRFGLSPNRFSSTHRHLHYATVGPDGRLYLAVTWTDELYVYDVHSNRLEVCGRFEPQSWQHPDTTHHIYGLEFDDAGKLWYTVSTTLDRCMIWSRLMSWDIFNQEAKPQCHGLLGDGDHIATHVSELRYHRGYLYLTDTNHGDDPPSVLRVDLSKLNNDDRPVMQDPHSLYYLKDGESLWRGDIPYKQACARVEAYDKSTLSYAKVLTTNASTVNLPIERIVRLWELTGAGEASIRSMRWIDNHTLEGEAGSSQPTLRRFKLDLSGDDPTMCIEDPKVLGGNGISSIPRDSWPEELNEALLPCRAGRRYRAKPASAISMADGSWIVGTQDGCLAHWKQGDRLAKSLGSVTPLAPIHDLVLYQCRVFGVAGNDSDMGLVFAFDDVQGLTELGRLNYLGSEHGGQCANYQPRLLAISADGKLLAVGTQDRLACVWIFSIE